MVGPAANEEPGAEMRRLREGLSLSRPAFARLLGVSRQAVWNWERGRRRPSTPCLRWARYLSRNLAAEDEEQREAARQVVAELAGADSQQGEEERR